jgi:hypothetical protein
VSRAVALVTSAEHPDLWIDDHPLRDALLAAGAAVQVERWDDASVDWARYDVVVIRSVWDYTWRRAEFLDWAHRVARVSDLHNPLPVVEWNTDKVYLRDLADRGVPVVPTAWLGPGSSPVGLAGLMAERGWTAGVVKPAVSAGGRDTIRFTADAAEGLASAQEVADRVRAEGGTVMVQPYLTAVDTVGERSLLFMAGELTHTVRRPPYLSAGLFADSVPAEPADDEIGVARAVLAAVDAHLDRDGEPLLYARVDLIRSDAGEPLLAEVELVEPQLFLRLSPDATAHLTAAVLTLLQHPGP